MRRTVLTNRNTFTVAFQANAQSQCMNSTRAMTGASEMRTYAAAIEKLNSTQSGAIALANRRRLGQKQDASSLEHMRKWLRCLGYEPTDLDRLNIVHVAGTKGKGTTCAFVDSILSRYRSTLGVPRRIGLYTSPHLLTVRERIRIDSAPLSEELFAKYFFEVWDALEASARSESRDPAARSVGPTYFRFLTLMSFHVFMREGVDAAVYEVGVGGAFDATNVVVRPAVTGVTTLGVDHVLTLGETVGEIAWHKAGVFKSGRPAFTVVQVEEAMEVLERKAEEKGVVLETVMPYDKLLEVGIKPAEEFQRKNAALAISLSKSLMDRFGVSVELQKGCLPSQMVEGLENVVWRGRCEVKDTEHVRWHLDGAHTEQSLEIACSWFGKVSGTARLPRALIFNQQSTRDAISLLKSVHRTIYNTFQSSFQYAIFCPNVTYRDSSYKIDFVDKSADPEALRSLSPQRELAATWRTLDPGAEVAVLPSIQDAVDYVEQLSCRQEGLHALVTGSFHLVGGVLCILEREESAVTNATAVV